MYLGTDRDLTAQEDEDTQEAFPPCVLFMQEIILVVPLRLAWFLLLVVLVTSEWARRRMAPSICPGKNLETQIWRPAVQRVTSRHPYHLISEPDMHGEGSGRWGLLPWVHNSALCCSTQTDKNCICKMVLWKGTGLARFKCQVHCTKQNAFVFKCIVLGCDERQFSGRGHMLTGLLQEASWLTYLSHSSLASQLG